MHAQPSDRRGVLFAVLQETLSAVLQQRGHDHDVSEKTTLIGPGAVLDSLGLVTLIVDLEERLLDDLGISITLVDERAMSARHSPFRTVGSLLDHILATEEMQPGA